MDLQTKWQKDRGGRWRHCRLNQYGGTPHHGALRSQWADVTVAAGSYTVEEAVYEIETADGSLTGDLGKNGRFVEAVPLHKN